MDRSSTPAGERECSSQAIAKAEAVRGNAARLVKTPTLCLCKRPDRRGPAARVLSSLPSSDLSPRKTPQAGNATSVDALGGLDGTVWPRPVASQGRRRRRASRRSAGTLQYESLGKPNQSLDLALFPTTILEPPAKERPPWTHRSAQQESPASFTCSSPSSGSSGALPSDASCAWNGVHRDYHPQRHGPGPSVPP